MYPRSTASGTPPCILLILIVSGYKHIHRIITTNNTNQHLASNGKYLFGPFGIEQKSVKAGRLNTLDREFITIGKHSRDENTSPSHLTLKPNLFGRDRTILTIKACVMIIAVYALEYTMAQRQVDQSSSTNNGEATQLPEPRKLRLGDQVYHLRDGLFLIIQRNGARQV